MEIFLTILLMLSILFIFFSIIRDKEIDSLYLNLNAFNDELSRLEEMDISDFKFEEAPTSFFLNKYGFVNYFLKVKSKPKINLNIAKMMHIKILL